MYKWSQEKNRVWLHTHQGKYYFDMPQDFNINDVSPSLKNLAIITLFSPFDKDVKKLKVDRSQGLNIGLCYSGGVDSTCALALLPKEKTILYYLYRTGIPTKLLKQENHLNIMGRLKKDYKLFVNSTNSEDIRKRYGRMAGHSTDWHIASGLILLADYYDLGYISAGMVLGSSYLHKGTHYRNFETSGYWLYWSDLFKKAGLNLILPCAGLSEIMTTYISNKVFGKMAMTCVRGEKGKSCGKCYKCFRKHLINKQKLPYSLEIKNNLNNKPVRFGHILVYCCKKYGFVIPEIKDIMKEDVSFCNRYYKKALNLIPEEYREYIENEIQKYCPVLKTPECLENFDIKSRYEK